MALILEMMALSGKTIEELLAGVQQFHSSTRKVQSSTEQARHIISSFQREYADCRLELLDGKEHPILIQQSPHCWRQS